MFFYFILHRTSDHWNRLDCLSLYLYLSLSLSFTLSLNQRLIPPLTFFLTYFFSSCSSHLIIILIFASLTSIHFLLIYFLPHLSSPSYPFPPLPSFLPSFLPCLATATDPMSHPILFLLLPLHPFTPFVHLEE